MCRSNEICAFVEIDGGESFQRVYDVFVLKLNQFATLTIRERGVICIRDCVQSLDVAPEVVGIASIRIWNLGVGDS